MDIIPRIFFIIKAWLKRIQRSSWCPQRSSPLRPPPPNTTLCVLALEHAPPKPHFATIENLSAPSYRPSGKSADGAPRIFFLVLQSALGKRGRIILISRVTPFALAAFRTNYWGALIWLGVCLSVLLCSSLTRLTHLDVVFFLFSIYIILSVYWLSSNNWLIAIYHCHCNAIIVYVYLLSTSLKVALFIVGLWKSVAAVFASLSVLFSLMFLLAAGARRRPPGRPPVATSSAVAPLPSLSAPLSQTIRPLFQLSFLSLVSRVGIKCVTFCSFF